MLSQTDIDVEIKQFTLLDNLVTLLGHTQYNSTILNELNFLKKKYLSVHIRT